MKKNVLSMFMAVLMLLTIIIPTTAAATDDGIALYSEACRYCERGVIRTTSNTKIFKDSPIDYIIHDVGGYTYACPVWETQTNYRTACTSCDREYATWSESGKYEDHVCR